MRVDVEVGGALAPDERFERWRIWLEGLRKEIGDRFVERQIWREMTDALDQHLPRSLGFRNHYARLYADAQAMAIRRLVDRDRDVRSLARLIIEIQLHRDVLTRTRFVDAHLGHEQRAGDLFDREFGRGCDHIADEVLERDLNKLLAVSEPVRRRANARVAHMTGAIPRPMTFANIHTALDLISDIFRRYYLLVFQTDLDPVPSLAGDWRSPFRAALFPAATQDPERR